LGEKVKPLVLGRGLPCKTAGDLQTDDRLRATRIEFLAGIVSPIKTPLLLIIAYLILAPVTLWADPAIIGPVFAKD